MKKTYKIIPALLFLLLSGCLAEEEAPIITSATYQHTQYNGRPQPIEVKTAKDDAPAPIITYFTSEADLEQGINGESAAPAGVGDYYVRLEHPAGNGYRQGKPVKIEYHIQKAFIAITAEPVQRAVYDGSPKYAAARTEPPEEPPLSFSYFDAASGAPLPSPPSARGRYRVKAVFPGNDRYMGASRELELRID
jgi:hypothetical protein